MAKKLQLLAILIFLIASPLLSQAQGKFFERGLAEVIPDGQNTGKNLGLHRELPVGTEIKVRNPANGFAIALKIVGRLPDTGANQKIILKLSEAAYRKLRASGRRFAVELSDTPVVRDITHEVREGETLFGISQKYKVSIDEIKEWNDLEDEKINLGQKLVILRKQ